MMSTIAEQLQEAADKATQASEQAGLWATGPDNTTVPTDSGPVPTIAEFNRAAQARVDASIEAIGWVLAGDFTAGCTVTDRNQYVLVVGGAGYRWDGELPKVVSPGSSPTPIATGSWVLISDPSIRVESVLLEASAEDTIRGRVCSELARVKAPTSAPANAGYSQGLFVDKPNRVAYVSFDPDSATTTTGTKYIGKYNIKTGELISETVITSPQVGHLDSIYFDGVNVLTTGNVGSPAILSVSPTTGAVITTKSLSISHTSQVLLAIDPTDGDSFTVWGRFGGDKIIVYGKISDAVGDVIQVKTSPIQYAQSDILQGISFSKDRVYLLTGVGGAGKKKITSYRVTTGELIDTILVGPELLFYSAYGSVYEPEGMCLSIEEERGAVQSNIYFGLVLGDGTKSGGFTSIIKMSKTDLPNTPKVDFYAGRYAGNVDYTMSRLHIRLRYDGTAWQVESGDFLSTLTKNTIKNLAVSPDNLSITFDLVKPYQDVIGANCDGSADFLRFARAKPCWVYKDGGASSMTGQQIRFADLDTAAYKQVNTSPVASGQRIFLTLDVIQ